MRLGRGCVAAVVAALAWGGLAEPAQAKKPVPTGPLGLTTISADTGDFLGEGTCPKRTKSLHFSWTGAPNAIGWGDVTPPGLTFSMPFRMQAATPGEQITVTVECQAWDGKALLVLGPVTVLSGNALAPTPPQNSGSGRRIVYSLAAQQVWLVAADESVVHTNLVSGRRLSLATKEQQVGTFNVLRKRAMSCNKPTRCPNMVHFHLTGGEIIGFHQIPYTRRPVQSEAELGQPRSHGCVRMSSADAKFLFDWVTVGDAVIVVP